MYHLNERPDIFIIYNLILTIFIEQRNVTDGAPRRSVNITYIYNNNNIFFFSYLYLILCDTEKLYSFPVGRSVTASGRH